MNFLKYDEENLPMQELETVGLASRGQLLLVHDDLEALLAGRRTGMLRLTNIESENIKIAAIDAKLSLYQNEQGKLELRIHPIWKNPEVPDFLDEAEALELERGDVHMLWKKVKDGKGGENEYLVEYDEETHEFIVSDTEKITAPDMVNNEFLTPVQKENYRKGKEVEMADGTHFKYSAKDSNGITSDRLLLVASVLMDGGLTYLMFKGLKAIAGEERDELKARTISPGLENAIEDMKNQQAERETDKDLRQSSRLRR